MRICPECNSEYREGFTRCGACGVDLIAPVSSPTMVMSQKMSAQEYLQNMETTSIVEAGLDACREIERELMAGDIHAYVSSEEVDDTTIICGAFEWYEEECDICPDDV